MQKATFVRGVNDPASDREMQEAAGLHSAFVALVEGCQSRAALNALTSTLVALYITTNPTTHSRRKLLTQVGAQYDHIARRNRELK